MLTKLRCCASGNDQYIDLAHVVSVEVDDTDFCGGMITSRGNYASVTVCLNNGHLINLTMERRKIGVLTEPIQVKECSFPELSG